MQRVHAEHHSSFVLSSLRTTFALDIPSDASPAFEVKIGDGSPMPTPTGGLEWKVRLCLLVAVASESSVVSPEGVRIKHLNRDGQRGEWGSSWKAAASIAPMERLDDDTKYSLSQQTQTWSQYFASSFLGGGEKESQDGDEGDADTSGEGMWDGDGEAQRDFGGGDEGWRDLEVETVECEVPIKVWPGNTAFKATDVVFDV
jgi:RAB6A-GEF complex partner protein 2